MAEGQPLFCTPHGQFCNIGGNENLIDLPVGYFQVFLWSFYVVVKYFFIVNFQVYLLCYKLYYVTLFWGGRL